jgi:hypothetical protein
MARRKVSVLGLVFGIINIVVALAPPCAGCFGATFFFGQKTMIFEGRDIGPPMNNHIERNLPAAKPEAIGAAACNSFLALLLIAGAAAMFFAQDWGRWVTIGAAFLMILTLCIHDIYQIFVFRPALMDFLDQQLPPGPHREGFKFGFSGSFFLWCWLNPIVMLYLIAMSIVLAVVPVVREVPDDDRPRRRRYADDRYDY